MKMILLIVTGIFFNLTAFAQSITFEPFGPMDKPLPVIEIQQEVNDTIKSKWEKRKSEVVYIYYVDLKNFKKILEAVSSMNTNVEFEKSFPYKYGTYMVKYNNIGKSYKGYMLNSYRESVVLFKKLLKLTDSNHDLKDEIKRMVNRLTIE